MEYRFRMSAYDAEGLKEETARLMQQRVEAHSRQTVPKLWAVTDRLNSREKVSPDVLARRRKRYRVYGVFLLLLGIFALVPGVMEPRVSLIAAGVIGILAGLLEFWLAKERDKRDKKDKKTPKPPLYCRQMAEELLAGRQAVDWSKNPAEVRFDGAGITLSTGKEQETLPYADITGVFETERLWLLADAKNMALLLQKKDLISGETEAFRAYLQGKIIKTDHNKGECI